MSAGQVFLNGINGITGQYFTPPLEVAEGAAAVRGDYQNAGPAPKDVKRDLPYNVNPLILAQTGCTTTCRRMFGLDKRCDSPTPPPPQQQFAPPPGAMVTGPANSGPAPCPCNTPK